MSLLLPAGFLVAAGLVGISSVSMSLFYFQLVWAALGAALVALFVFVDWRSLLNFRWIVAGFYVLTVILLIVVYFKGPVIRNTRSWFVLGPVSFQPVELMKIALILLYAEYFSRRHLLVGRWRTILASFAYFALPAALVALQPDLGSVLILFNIWFGFLLVSGLPWRRVIIALAAFAIAGLFMWQGVLEQYQKERILGVFFPERNALSINYSVIQSKIAIGSAGMLGKGYGQGTQTQLGFLSEPANDFILSVLIEEWGWLAGLAIMGIFALVVYRMLRVGALADQNFEKFICLGATIVFGLQFIVNAGSATGLSPVIGVTFPFMSYGGSSFLTNAFLLAIVNAIGRRS